MRLSGTKINCGVYQLTGVSGCNNTAGCEELLNEVKDELKSKHVMEAEHWTHAHRRPPVIMFSDRSPGGGDKFAAYIKKHKLGDVEESKLWLNTSVFKNKCRIWMWYLDYDALGLQEVAKHYQ